MRFLLFVCCFSIYSCFDVVSFVDLNAYMCISIHPYTTEHNLMDYSLLVGVVRRHFQVTSRDGSKKGSGYSGQGQGQGQGRVPLKSPESGSRVGGDSQEPTEEGPAASVGASESASARVSLAQSRDSDDFSSRPSNPFELDDDGGVQVGSVEQPGTYYIGIIDVLQEWNFKKRAERFIKTSLGLDAWGISAIEPNEYLDRFVKFAVEDVFEGLSSAAGEAGDTSVLSV